jgi:hypothetical protein
MTLAAPVAASSRPGLAFCRRFPPHSTGHADGQYPGCELTRSTIALTITRPNQVAVNNEQSVHRGCHLSSDLVNNVKTCRHDHRVHLAYAAARASKVHCASALCLKCFRAFVPFDPLAVETDDQPNALIMATGECRLKRLPICLASLLPTSIPEHPAAYLSQSHSSTAPT